MFQSPTYGSVEMRDIVRIIAERVSANKGRAYNLMVGTDSQNFDKTKVVVVIALHDIGKGGIFFYQISHIPLIRNVSQKLIQETQMSLACAQKLIDAFEEYQQETGFDYKSAMQFDIHVDAGQGGKSKVVIPEIVGWVTACGYHAVVKPDSLAASSIANKYSK